MILVPRDWGDARDDKPDPPVSDHVKETDNLCILTKDDTRAQFPRTQVPLNILVSRGNFIRHGSFRGVGLHHVFYKRLHELQA